MKLIDSIPALKAALKGKTGDLDAWLEANEEEPVRLAILYLVKEARQACANAVLANSADQSLAPAVLLRAHQACMNTDTL